MPKRYRTKKGGKKWGKRRKTGTGKFQYGPVGGVRPGRFGTTQVSIPRSRIGPDRQFVTLSRSYIGTGSTAAFALFGTLKANSANDPLGTFGTGGPTGGAPFLGPSTTSMYGAYIVHAFRLDLEVNANVFGAYFGLLFRPNSMSAALSAGSLDSQSHGQVKMVNVSGVTRWGMYRTTGQIYGQAPVTVATADSFSALYNADPSSEVVADLYVGNTDGVTATAFSVKIRLTQYVEVYGRNTV